MRQSRRTSVALHQETRFRYGSTWRFSSTNIELEFQELLQDRSDAARTSMRRWSDLCILHRLGIPMSEIFKMFLILPSSTLQSSCYMFSGWRTIRLSPSTLVRVRTWSMALLRRGRSPFIPDSTLTRSPPLDNCPATSLQQLAKGISDPRLWLRVLQVRE